MKKLELGPSGMSLNVSTDGAHLREAAELEDLGYSTIWLAGGQLDSLDPLTEIIRATSSILVGSSIIPLDVYSSEQVAATFADIETDHSGRFIVGLGGPQRPKALQAMNDFLDRLDTAEPPVPVGRRVLAANGPRKLELARDRFAGAMPLLVTPGYTARARRILGVDSTLIVSQFVVLDTDPGRARETARGPLRFLLGGGIPGYTANVRRMGFTDDEISSLSDQLVDALVVWGDADAIVARVDEHRRAGADQVALAVLAEGSQPRPIQAARQLAAQLLS
ncbi:MAG: TIGR03620 family F420-dependent LLM class oxidoreductase [Actinomycetota bacterium]|nr:TIGR03620 family F420-dependent LLM class oxidoreductase [Actinomycetota bacterium]